MTVPFRTWWSHNACAGRLLVALLGVALFAVANCPAAAHTAEEAKSLAERAVAHIHDVGRDQAFADFSRPDGGFVDGELYIFCQDVSGVVVAHGGNPQLVGRNLAGVRGPDGRLPNVE